MSRRCFSVADGTYIDVDGDAGTRVIRHSGVVRAAAVLVGNIIPINALFCCVLNNGLADLLITHVLDCLSWRGILKCDPLTNSGADDRTDDRCCILATALATLVARNAAGDLVCVDARK